MQDDYSRFSEVFRTHLAPVTVAESHGMLCAHLCVQGEGDPAVWLTQIFGAPEVLANIDPESGQALAKLYGSTVEQLKEGDFAFKLLLPDDETPIGDRATALGQWCEGFLHGFGESGITSDSTLSEEVREHLNDLTQITRVLAPDDEEGEEEDESAYLEIVEYVRMGVLLINEEFRPVRDAKSPSGEVH